MKLHRAANTARETMESIALGFAQMGSMGYSVPATALYAGGAFGVSVYAIAYNAPWVAAVLGGGTIAYRTAARGFRQIDAMTRGSCLSSTNVHDEAAYSRGHLI